MVPLPADKYEFWYLMNTGVFPCPPLFLMSAGDGYLAVSDGGPVSEYEHRIVLEEWLCRKLEGTELAHHINGNKSDNRPENIILCRTAKEHHSHHPHTWYTGWMRSVESPKLAIDRFLEEIDAKIEGDGK